MSERIRAGYIAPRRRGLPWGSIALALVSAALGAGGWWVWQQSQLPSLVRPSGLVTPKIPSWQEQSKATAAEAGYDENDPLSMLVPRNLLDMPAPAPVYLLEPEPNAPKLPPLAQADPVVNSALARWLGKGNTFAFVQNDRFVRRFVATVDSLPRAQTPARIWPVNPTRSRFQVSDARADTALITPANAARYQPMVQFVRSINVKQAARQYRMYYPLFQQAYEEMGYPGWYFNDRLIAVIDHLLQAPEPAEVEVRLLHVKGKHRPNQPWTRYEFADPELEKLSSGHKILVRMGPENARALKEQMRLFRDQIAVLPPEREIIKPLTAGAASTRTTGAAGNAGAAGVGAAGAGAAKATAPAKQTAPATSTNSATSATTPAPGKANASANSLADAPTAPPGPSQEAIKEAVDEAVQEATSKNNRPPATP